VAAWFTSTFLTYCIVRVELPCSMAPDSTLVAIERTTPRKSTPLWSRNRESSMAAVACLMYGEMLSIGTSTRFW
jgi:hypothetical protein